LFSKFNDELQYIRKTGSVLQRTLARALDHRAVGHRVRERHAKLEDVGARLDQRAQQRNRERGVRVARRDVGIRALRLAPARDAKRAWMRDISELQA